ncbi:MAG TPA: sialidase family protein [Leadbetterella sp.]|nr:sialidase family protein [Leadbetterella sp.]
MTRLIFTIPLVFLGLLVSMFSTDIKQDSEMTICAYMPQNKSNVNSPSDNNASIKAIDIPFENDPNKAYSMPLLAKTSSGDVMLSWTEKDDQGLVSFCVAFSKNQGKTFSDKKVIFSGNGIGNSRMMRAKVLSKKNGTFVAIFTNRSESAPNASGRGGRSSNIVFCESKDGGNTWTKPANVDSDPKQGIVRGFFDAIVMSNDEIAVAYLKDVAKSTKHEERDLRLVTSKDGIFQPERLIDPVVCDCCPINFLIDAEGRLNVFYRDNNDNIRDIARIVSGDNGQTFSKPEIVFNDKWEINGCPHSGAVSTINGKGGLVSWFSGTDNEMGIRVATTEGKRLFVLDDASAKNQYLVKTPTASVLFWEQNKDQNNPSQVAFRKIEDNKASEMTWVEGSANSTNVVGLNIGNTIIIANEIIQSNKKNKIKISTLSI